MVNLSNLQHIEPLNLSVDLTDPDILETAVATTNETTGGYFGLVVGIVIYIFLMYITTKENSEFSLDFIKASLMSSGLVIVIMVVMLALNMMASFLHLMWFVVIFLLSLLGAYFLKDKE